MNIPGIPRHDHVQLIPVSQEALGQMQHDIRSPLGAILGISDLLSAMASTPEQKKIAAMLKSSSENLKSQLDALFEWVNPGEGSDIN